MTPKDDKIPESITGDNTRSRETLNKAITGTLMRALRIAWTDPRLLAAGAGILSHQRRAAGLRRRYEKEGLLVPAVIIVSITSRCNLSCAGCYMKNRRKTASPDLAPETFESMVAEAAALGVSVIVIAGGEPLLRKREIIGTARDFPRVLFPVFTNGLMIDDDLVSTLSRVKNIVPVISFEGFEAATDRRRGDGVYSRLLASCSRLKEGKIFFGCSVTVTSANLEQVLDEGFITALIGSGTRIFVFVEYVPVEPGTDSLVLTDNQRKTLRNAVEVFSGTYPALFIDFPGDDSVFDGCLAAGRGFVHISPSGDLEPCPAAPFSDANLVQMSLKEALRSDLLRQIRADHQMLTETGGGCALWTNREWTGSLLKKKGEGPPGVL